MGSRFSTRRAFLPILVLAGFTLVQAAGISQTESGGARQTARPGTPAGRTEARQDDAELRRLVRSLRHFRSIGDRESAARIFAQIFPTEAAVDPSVAAKTAASPLSNRIEAAFRKRQGGRRKRSRQPCLRLPGAREEPLRRHASFG